MNDVDDTQRIAVIGMAGRFPGAGSVDELWPLLMDGREAITRFTEPDLRAAGVPESLWRNHKYVPAKGVLDDVAGFDSVLFGFTGLEADVLDPQHRLLLECAWTAFEDAGRDPERVDGPVAVYAGAMLSTYLIQHLLGRPDLQEKLGIPLLYQANQTDQLAARVAYKLNLRGAAVTVQTACSTSLVAVHLAVQSLLSHESDLALAGGVSVTVPHRAGYLHAEGGIESRDGHCRPFAADADGTVFGNGAGVVVLKRLADAIEDGDRVHAVILGSAVNNDGAHKAGFTAPSVSGQTAVIREALDMAGVHPGTIGYVEAHGTGTPIGDPIEAAALSAAYAGHPGKCALGSLKATIGHLDTAAGIAGLIKTILVLRNGKVPAGPHRGAPNPELDLGPFFLPDETTGWAVAGGPRRAAVSSFGVGGTNAHVVLEQAPEQHRMPAPPGPHVLTLSARTPTALTTLAERLAADLRAHPERELATVAATLQHGRRELEHRLTVVAGDTARAVEALRGELKPVHADATGAVFLVPGQGLDLAGVAGELYDAEPVFRAAVDECAVLLGLDLATLLRDGSTEELTRTEVTQPVVFTIGYAMAQLWLDRGVRPAAVLGHSLGEYTAACVAGVFTLPDALRLVSARGALMAGLPPGAMAALPVDGERAAELAREHDLDLAAVNGPRSSVLSGTAEAVRSALEALAAQGVRGVRLPGARAFHSRAVESITARFADVVVSVTLSAPSIPLMSGVTGARLSAEQATDPAHWVRQLREPVRFHAAVRAVADLVERPVFVETGPGGVLTDLVRAARLPHAALVPAPLSKKENGVAGALAGMWARGLPVRWPQGGRRATLPGYPFERREHWVTPAAPADSAVLAEPPAVLSGPRWRVQPIREQDPLQAKRSTWLVFVDDDGPGQRLADLLTARGQIVTCLRPGAEFKRVKRGQYELNPVRGEDYAALLRELRALVRTPTAVLHCWAPADADRGFFSLVRLARALTAESVVHDVRLGVVTTAGHAVADGDQVDPDAALLGGVCSVLPAEYPNLTCTQIDLAGDWVPADVVRAALVPTAPLVALRGGREWLRSFEELPAPATADVLRDGGGYVITGGLGGIGLALADHLARTRSARLVLLTRREVPDWRDPSTEATEVVRALRKLAEVSPALHVVRADVTDASALKAALAVARTELGRIDGVVHAAGVPGGGAAELRPDELMRSVLAPKVDGTRHLLAALRDDEADFLVLCSSLSSIVPTYGQIDYTAANAYLDGVAAAEAVRGKRRTWSLDWDMWSEVGMAAGAVVPESLRALHGTLVAGGLTTDQGVRAFEASLGTPPGQVVVARAAGVRALTARTPSAPATTRHARPELRTAYTAPETELEQRLTELWQELLGIDRVGLHDGFVELGGHSLLAAQVVARLRASYDVEIPVLVFFEGGSVADVAERIEDMILAQVQQ
ncbi:hypothetical protein BS329_35285 [Amycolatopsis coloradensis]|uniref:Phenolphthiocerol/phthiocerol polyketide synthase subunit E n=1 Tax=Amycolatopsis coloradensis TaxID=76021 RepID=A0A1R0KH73_9PSEU|nr:type I polyketide synthase [Amycolatopsis coloradensis]OLZ45016.1 hypothetical protein BS329_35285 [Amycolatopsis coloradensis]